MHAAGNDDLGLRLGALAAAWLAGVGLQLQRAELASLLPLALLGGGAALSLLIAWRRRLLWLAHASMARGALYKDSGAVRAVTQANASLLAAGITKVTGDLKVGSKVTIEYTMKAAAVEVKEAKKAEAKEAKKAEPKEAKKEAPKKK